MLAVAAVAPIAVQPLAGHPSQSGSGVYRATPMSVDTALRQALAAVALARPALFARRLAAPAGPAVQAAEVAVALKGALPAAITVDGVSLALAADPAALVTAGTAGSGDLVGQAVLVTGGASGLGLGIARGLLSQGAAVTLADVDVAGLAQVMAELAEPARVHTARMDVTDEVSVAAAFDSHLARYGRLDGLVCAAGIAPPYNLVDFPLDKWRLALEINLTGYFLCGREAARIMLSAKRGGSMVLLSSKSGLEPSKANSAYNATKAGELHLARGWALELGRDGIRVNCIAPGNVFEGSKIWNPEYIRKAAEKKGIKPEEVIPYYNGLTALNAEIKPQDIAEAAVYLLSPRARRMTGQVLVVDAGQVWTR
jgi:NAD(P)-dependent dehydrogenase (short-subunit alcohol dehydrogenase family)